MFHLSTEYPHAAIRDHATRHLYAHATSVANTASEAVAATSKRVWSPFLVLHWCYVESTFWMQVKSDGRGVNANLQRGFQNDGRNIELRGRVSRNYIVRVAWRGGSVIQMYVFRAMRGGFQPLSEDVS